jgi:hypothetical protein
MIIRVVAHARAPAQICHGFVSSLRFIYHFVIGMVELHVGVEGRATDSMGELGADSGLWRKETRKTKRQA